MKLPASEKYNPVDQIGRAFTSVNLSEGLSRRSQVEKKLMLSNFQRLIVEIELRLEIIFEGNWRTTEEFEQVGKLLKTNIYIIIKLIKAGKQ